MPWSRTKSSLRSSALVTCLKLKGRAEKAKTSPSGYTLTQNTQTLATWQATTLCLKRNNGTKGCCPANLPSRGGRADWEKGMDRTLMRPSRSHLNKKAEALLGRLQLWSLGSLARQRETHWVLNSLHLCSEGHLQRLKQLNIPPSGALTPTSHGTTAPYISNLQLQIQLLFFFHPATTDLSHHLH